MDARRRCRGSGLRPARRRALRILEPAAAPANPGRRRRAGRDPGRLAAGARDQATSRRRRGGRRSCWCTGSRPTAGRSTPGVEGSRSRPTWPPPAFAPSRSTCAATETRARGRSEPAPGPSTTTLNEDVPAALDAIRRETGEAQVLWVGHSLGAVARHGLLPAPPRSDRRHRRHRRSHELRRGRPGGRLREAGRPGRRPLQPDARADGGSLGGARPPARRRPRHQRPERRPGGVPAAPRQRHRERLRARSSCSSASGSPGTSAAPPTAQRDYRAGLAGCRQPALFLAAPRRLARASRRGAGEPSTPGEGPGPTSSSGATPAIRPTTATPTCSSGGTPPRRSSRWCRTGSRPGATTVEDRGR